MPPLFVAFRWYRCHQTPDPAAFATSPLTEKNPVILSVAKDLQLIPSGAINAGAHSSRPVA